MPTTAAIALLCAVLVAQEPQPPAPKPTLEQEARALIDEFIRVMPRNPSDLRRPAVRRELAPRAMPALRAILEFVQAHPESTLTPRSLEFTVYSLVLGDEQTRSSLGERANDPSAQLLLHGAAVIAAGDGKQRAAAIDAVASGLGRRQAIAEPPAPGPSETARSCVATCLLIAADLDEREAGLLAERAVDPDLAKRFAAAAELALRDPRRLLDKPFELRGKLVNGDPFTTADLRGKVVLVDFWATWCVPCVRALPEIVACREKFAAKGLVVLGISSDREQQALTKFLAAHPEVDWPQLFDPPADGGFHPLATANGVQSIPRLFLIDRAGILRSIDAHAELERLLTRYLAE